MSVRSTVVWVTALAILVLVNYGVFQKENLRTNGQPVYLELAPVDPRSLIQGDYMLLDYAVLRPLDLSDLPDAGQLRVELDENSIATAAHLYQDAGPLSANEVLINYRKNGWRLHIGADNFFFQEGQADIFAEAEYAEVRVGPSGDLILVGLLDENLEPLEPQ